MARPKNLPYMTSLNLLNLTNLTNYPILHNATWSLMPTKIPSYIPKFNRKSSEDLVNHFMTFHLWFSSKSISDDSIQLRLFQSTLIGPLEKWYIKDKPGSHATFTSLGNDFLSFFELPLHHDTSLEILSCFPKTTSTHIVDHIHEWHR